MLRQTARARADLIEIWTRLAEQNPDAADRLLDRIAARLEILKDFPHAGTALPALAPEARMLVEAPYLILYRADEEGVLLVRVLHGKREIGAALFAEGLDRPGE
ncbi:type II toxin-antitoxin system RelE/ParE family toxin [Teichococcus cervicalis]|uniref:Toxin-antitoxin system, toxin component, RelE family n=1 Tax=Pseudoroseomonas cervicalis ATCC 49957 TaxID=525371 RepID=D5RG17_9PROT|nr:type II toxin-antitoxin system RelE/ParE family toxin [Pseudoroseomonas cervicalis]EFH13747.1 toxin-antitoxin system, toxin component, RelE family [Pseudoroseomonas cervicalis ATCC 49957]